MYYWAKNNQENDHRWNAFSPLTLPGVTSKLTENLFALTIGLLLAATTFPGQAASSEAHGNQQPLLAVSPDICVLGETQSKCRLDLRIQVNVADTEGFCIEVAEINYQHCVDAVSVTTVIEQVEISSNFDILVLSRDGKRVLAEKELSVADFYPTHPQPRKNLGWILM